MVPRLKKALRVPTPADRGPGRPWRAGSPPAPIDPDLPSEMALRTAREVKAHAPHCRVVFTVYEMKRLGRDAAELTAARKGKHGGRPLITDDMLHTVRRRRAGGESVEMIGIVTPAASAAPMPSETSTVTPMCAPPCYQ